MIERLLMITLYPAAKMFVFGIILIIGIARILYEIAMLQVEE